MENDVIDNIDFISERLAFQRVSPIFRDNIYEEFTFEITLHMIPSSPSKISDIDSFIENAQKAAWAGEEIHFVILIKHSSEFVGVVGIHKLKEERPELGIWIKKEAQHNGFGKEAILSAMKWASKTYGKTAFTYPVHSSNLKSLKIPESLGGRIVANYKKSTPKGTVLDILEYQIDFQTFNNIDYPKC